MASKGLTEDYKNNGWLIFKQTFQLVAEQKDIQAASPKDIKKAAARLLKFLIITKVQE